MKKTAPLKKWSLLLISLLLLTFAIDKLWDKLNDSFSPANISCSSSALLTSMPDSTSPEERAEAMQALHQNYSYLGKGVQCWAFVSDDGKYVLKFFKMHRFKVPTWLETFPLKQLFSHEYCSRQQALEQKIIRNFSSFKLASEQLRQESGLVAVHLQKSTSWNTHVTVSDKMRWPHTINVNEAEFVLQRRAELVAPRLHKLMQQGKVDEAKQHLSDLISLLVLRCTKGIGDSDPGLFRNIGFLENGKAILIDVGRLYIDLKLKEPTHCKQEILSASRKLLPWLEQHYPELASHYLDELGKQTLK